MTDLWGVAVGGLIASVAGVATQWSVHFIRTREERRNRSIAKFEELVAAIYEHDRWMDSKLNYHTFREGEEPGVNPMARIEALCCIYFPQHVYEAALMDYAARQYVSWMTNAGSKRLANQQDYMDGYAEALDPYLNAFRVLLASINANGRKTFAPKTKPAPQTKTPGLSDPVPTPAA